MNPLVLLLGNRRRATAAALREAGWAQTAVIAVFLLIAAGIFVGAYLFFLRAFRFLLIDPLSGPLIARYVLDASFAFVFFLGVASFVISSSQLFFRSDELGLLMAMPVEPFTVFLYRFVSATALSAWPLMLIAAPALAALGTAIGGGIGYDVACVAVVALFALTISVTGGLIAFLVAPLLRRLHPTLRGAVGALAFIGGALLLVRLVIPRAVFTLFNVGDEMQAADAGARLDAMFAGMPSHPFARIVTAAASITGVSQGIGTTVLGAGTALSLAVVALFIAASRWYLPLWHAYGERTFIARPDVQGVGRRRSPFPRVLRFGHGFLFEKDLLSLLRDGNELSRAGFLGLLLFMYVISMRAVARVEVFTYVDLFAAVVAFAFAAVGYFALTFCMRFVFPAFSLEGRGAWMLLSSPIHIHEVFSWKYFFWSAVLLVLMVPAGAFIGIIFQLPFALGVLLVFAVVCAALSFVALTLGQGALHPRLREKDPDEIATTPAGLATTAVGILYLAIVAGYVYRAVLAFLRTGVLDAQGMLGILIVSVAVVGTHWVWVTRALDRKEFAA